MTCVATVQVDSSTVASEAFDTEDRAHEWVRQWIWDQLRDEFPGCESRRFNGAKISLYTSEVGPVWGTVVILV